MLVVRRQKLQKTASVKQTREEYGDNMPQTLKLDLLQGSYF